MSWLKYPMTRCLTLNRLQKVWCSDVKQANKTKYCDLWRLDSFLWLSCRSPRKKSTFLVLQNSMNFNSANSPGSQQQDFRSQTASTLHSKNTALINTLVFQVNCHLKLLKNTILLTNYFQQTLRLLPKKERAPSPFFFYVRPSDFL